MEPACARGSAAVLSVHPHRPVLLGHRGGVSARGYLGLSLEHRRRLCRAVSVGHSMFFGVGAYTPLLFYHLWGLPPVAGVPAGMLVSLALAVAIGMPTFRLQGHYFSMATIAVAELIRIFVGTWDLVGAAIGLQGPAVGRAWWDLTFRSELPYYYIFLAVLAVVLYTTFEVERSRFGYYLRAIKAGERAARSLGVPVRATKLKALMLSVVFTSVAGSLYSIKTGFIDPESG